MKWENKTNKKTNCLKYGPLLVALFVLFFAFQGGAEESFKGKTIKIVYANKWAPISYETTDAQIKGLLPDRMEQLLGNGMGMMVEHIPVPWGRAQQMIKSGAADAFVTTVTPERLTYSYASRAKVFILPFVPAVTKYSSEDHLLTDPDNLNQFQDRLFCDVLGNGWADYFYKDKNVQLHIVPTINECLRLLNAGRAQVIIHAKPVLEKYIGELGFTDRIVLKDTASVRSPQFSLMLSKKSALGENFIKAFDAFFKLQSGPSYEQ